MRVGDEAARQKVAAEERLRQNGRAGPHSGAGASSAGSKLASERERAVLTLMAEGRSNAGIAARLYLSPKSVERHVAAVFDKLGLPPDGDDNRRGPGRDRLPQGPGVIWPSLAPDMLLVTHSWRMIRVHGGAGRVGGESPTVTRGRS
jgi:DNA-binding CsgD family transcriptional regulator